MDAENPPVSMTMTSRPKVKKMFSWSDDSPSIADGWVSIKVQTSYFFYIPELTQNLFSSLKSSLSALLMMVGRSFLFTIHEKKLFLTVMMMISSVITSILIRVLEPFEDKVMSFLLCSWKKKQTCKKIIFNCGGREKSENRFTIFYFFFFSPSKISYLFFCCLSYFAVACEEMSGLNFYFSQLLVLKKFPRIFEFLLNKKFNISRIVCLIVGNFTVH